MAIAVKCICGTRFRSKDELLGKRVRCPKCGEAVTVPAGSTPGSAEAARPAGAAVAAPSKEPQNAMPKRRRWLFAAVPGLAGVLFTFVLFQQGVFYARSTFSPDMRVLQFDASGQNVVGEEVLRRPPVLEIHAFGQPFYRSEVPTLTLEGAAWIPPLYLLCVATLIGVTGVGLGIAFSYWRGKGRACVSEKTET